VDEEPIASEAASDRWLSMPHSKRKRTAGLPVGTQLLAIVHPADSSGVSYFGNFLAVIFVRQIERSLTVSIVLTIGGVTRSAILALMWEHGFGPDEIFGNSFRDVMRSIRNRVRPKNKKNDRSGKQKSVGMAALGRPQPYRLPNALMAIHPSWLCRSEVEQSSIRQPTP
jgi:hypothetical protein